MCERRYFVGFIVVLVWVFGVGREVFGGVGGQFKEARGFERKEEYGRAEEIYLEILAGLPDANDALRAQTGLTCAYVGSGKTEEAEAAFGKLTGDFAGHDHIANSVWQVGLKYKRAGKAEKAEEIHRHNVANFGGRKAAMWSQVEIVYSRIDQGDNAGADVAVNTLLSDFSGQETLSKEIHQVGKK